MGALTSRKYRNIPVIVDGVSFPSKREADRWQNLRLLERAGRISDLQRQVPFRMEINGYLICRLIVDFAYKNNAGELVAEDAKGVRTPTFRLKAKLLKALHGLDVVLS